MSKKSLGLLCVAVIVAFAACSPAKDENNRFPEFGKHTKGRIGLQDWSKGVSFRNVKIKEL